MKRKMSVIAILILAIVVLFTACGTNETTDLNEQVDKNDTLIVAITADVTDFDAHGNNAPHNPMIRTQVYETLLEKDQDMNLVPSLAESWEYEDDTTLIFHLRKDVKFHNGEQMTSKDVVWSLKRACDSSFSGDFLKAVDKEAIVALDEYTVKVPLHYAFGPILFNITNYDVGIMNEKAFTDAGDTYNDSPVGTGPFKLKNWVRGDRLEFERFEEYWGDEAKVQNLVMRVIPEASSRVIEVETGGVNIAYDILPNDAKRLEQNNEIEIIRTPQLRTNYIGFNCSKKPFDDVRVRQALSYAVDREALVENVYQGSGVLSRGPIQPSCLGFNEDLKLPEYNPEKARELLREAGYPDGFSTAIYLNESQQSIDTAEILQNYYSAVGVTAEVNVLEQSSFLSHIVDSTQDIYILGWNSFGETYRGLYQTFHSSTASSQNTARYANTEVDNLLEIGRKSVNDAERTEAYRKAQEIIIEEAPWIPLVYTENITVIGKDIEGFINMPTAVHKLYDVYFE